MSINPPRRKGNTNYYSSFSPKIFTYPRWKTLVTTKRQRGSSHESKYSDISLTLSLFTSFSYFLFPFILLSPCITIFLYFSYFLFLYFSLSVCWLSIYLSIHPSKYLYIFVSIYLSMYLSVHPIFSIYVICPSIYLFSYLSNHFSVVTRILIFRYL